MSTNEEDIESLLVSINNEEGSSYSTFSDKQVQEQDYMIVIDRDGESLRISDDTLRNADPKTKTLLSEKIKSAMMIIISAPKGAAQLYATFGPIAMIYQQEGMWLTAPVATGAAISVSHSMLHALKTHCLPDNKFVKFLSNASLFLDDGFGGFMADFGFAWSMMRNLGTTFGPLLGASKDVVKNYTLFATPLLAFAPALVDRTVRYKDKQGKLYQRSIFRHIARTLRGATSTLGLINQLVLQGVIATDSYIPTVIMLLTAITGGASSLLEESHGTVSMLMMAAINLLCENPSLATAFFSFPNDIYAGLNEGSISDEFFYTNLAISVCFLIGLEGLSLMTMATKAKESKGEAEPSDNLLSDEDEMSDNYLTDDEDKQGDEIFHDCLDYEIELSNTDEESSDFDDCEEHNMPKKTTWCNIL